jgi:signal transduction histidine kinase
MDRGEPSKPSFLWQAALILLPVVVLAVIGWASLRQDKILAEHDAQQRAQALAEQLAPTLWTQLVVSPDEELTNKVEFEVNESGALIFPPSYDLTPSPAPLPFEQLSPEQAQLWATSQNPSVAVLVDATAACQRLIDSNPPPRFAAAAQYQLGVLLLQQHRKPAAIKSFNLVTSKYPDAVGESGLPLQPLAQFKLLEVEPGPIDSFCSNIVYHPTLLTPFLLGQVASAQTNQSVIIQNWQHTWAEHERAREIYAAASEHLRASAPFLAIGTNKIQNAPVPSMFWFKVPTYMKAAPVKEVRDGQVRWRPTNENDRAIVDENWIAMRAAAETNGLRFVCRRGSDLMFPIMRITQHIPDYFGVGVELAGQQITRPNYWNYESVFYGKGGGQHWEKKDSDKISTNLLASATHSGNAGEALIVSVFLTNSKELYASQQSRALWFGLLVIVSTISALIGLAAAWRAFHRQLRLAEMKSNFVSSVSHELRAPIASVRLMAESLERGKVAAPQKQNEYFRFIVQECRRLSSLIENVLDFSRIEQGRKQYEFEPTDLLALTRETVKLMEPYAEEKGVRLETSNLEHRTPNVELEVDGRAIQQALVNLIDNAIKHSAKGQSVTIGLDCGDRGTDILPASNFSGKNSDSETGKMPVLLYVEDSGPGIPPAEHEKIFERFYRLGSELRRETQGVGIGLSIVKHIVEAHGGRVTVRSNVGQGSRFTIQLPANQQEQTEKTEGK